MLTLIGVVCFFLGFFSANAQIILLREILNFGGGSELTLATGFFFWLAGIGFGAFLLSLIEVNSSLKNTFLSYLSLTLTIVFSYISITLSRILPSVLIHPGQLSSLNDIFLFSFLIMFFPCFFMGCAFPLLVREGKKRLSGSTLYLIEAAGSAAGGAIFNFLFAGKINHVTIISLSSLPLGIMLIIFLICNNSIRHLSARILVSTPLSVVITCFLLTSQTIDKKTNDIRFHSIAGKIKLLTTVETLYQRLDLAIQKDQYSIFSDGTFSFAFPEKYDTKLTTTLVLLMHPAPETILIIGGSPVESIKIAREHDLKRIDYLQIDPTMMKLIEKAIPEFSRKYFCRTCGARFISEDGRGYVNSITSALYDILWVNISDPKTLILNRYYTVEFYQKVKRALKKGGIFVSSFNLDWTSPQKHALRYGASIFNTLRSSFKYIEFAIYDRVIIFASDEKVNPSPTQLSKRAISRGLDPYMNPPELFENFFPHERLNWLKQKLLTTEAVINTDLHPVTYRLQLQQLVHLIESSLSRGGKETIAEKILEKSWNIKLHTALIPVMFMITILFIFRKTTRGASSSSFVAMFATGGGGIILQLCLLFSFQTLWGIIYQAIGILYATFMAGLVAGTWTGYKVGGKNYKLSEILTIINAVIISIALSLCAGKILLIFLFVFSSGFTTGLSFPILYTYHMEIKKMEDKDSFVSSAGIIDSADHIGASVGAIACGLILIPSFGIKNSIALIGLYKIATLISLIITERKTR